ncbi:MAG: PspC domain-containing protein [Cellulophaga sp.]
MNKTININLANNFFHMDDVAYSKLQRYLAAVKRSFADTKGSDEILTDIEARIAELFNEKLVSKKEIITEKEVDEVVAIMGKPEDYMIDEDIFDDAPKSASRVSKAKKLYRDINAKYIGGVCSGLEHYLGFDSLWIRIIFILLTVFSGFGILIYILLWILVPEAATTSQQLDMRGKAINISNIERKVKEGFTDVADKVKNANYEKMGNSVKSSSKTFFDTIGDVFMFFFKVFAKFIGIIMIITGASALIGLFIGMFSIGIMDMIHVPGIDFVDMVNSTNTPLWLLSILGFFAIGIPFFFLLYLGLKILAKNPKSIGNTAKYSLLGLWLAAVIGLSTLGIQQASSHAYSGTTSIQEEIYLDNPIDTLVVAMNFSEAYKNQDNIGVDGITMAYKENGDRILFKDGLHFNIKKSADSIVRIKIKKEADGSTFNDAKERSGKIEYNYEVKENTIILNDFLVSALEDKVRNQDVRITLYIPENMQVKFDKTAKNHLGWDTSYDQKYYRGVMTTYTWKMDREGELICLNCPETEEEIEEDNNSNGPDKIIINEDGIDINIQGDEESLTIEINEDGVKIESKEKDSTIQNN